MVFRNDKQRKAVMAKLNSNTRSNNQPTVLGRLRKRFRPTAQEQAVQRGVRIQTEAEALRLERLRTQQLEAEARVESERQSVRARERQARTTLAEIDRERRSRTFGGRVIAGAMKSKKIKRSVK